MQDDNHEHHDKETKARILKNIDEHGFHICYFPSDGYLPSFYYTIGFFQKYQKPEIVIFALPQNTITNICHKVAEIYESGQSLETLTNHQDFIQDFPVRFLQADKVYYPYYFGYGMWFYQSDSFPVLELVWTDKQGFFPWQDEFDPDWKYVQPLMDRNIDFLFNEPRNLATYTEQAILNGEPILEVYHDFDGDWQFVTSREFSEEDMPKLVSLDCMVKLDPTLNQIHYLNYGEMARREHINSDWHFEPMKQNDIDSE